MNAVDMTSGRADHRQIVHGSIHCEIAAAAAGNTNGLTTKESVERQSDVTDVDHRRVAERAVCRRRRMPAKQMRDEFRPTSRPPCSWPLTMFGEFRSGAGHVQPSGAMLVRGRAGSAPVTSTGGRGSRRRTASKTIVAPSG